MTTLHDHPSDPGPTPPPAVDPSRWPDIARAPQAPVRGWAARQVTRLIVARVPLRVALEDGTVIGGPADAPVLRVVRPDAFFARLGTAGLIGFGEAYMAGDWESDDLVGVLTALADNAARLIPAPLQRLGRFALPRRARGDANTRRGSRANISHHYDLSNDLFRTFLDPTLSYSSAVFETDATGAPAIADPLADAQRRKVARILDLARVGEGTSLLEIGTGWGELALQAAARGARVTSLTLSSEQAAEARARLEDAGVADRVEVLLRDYRDATGRYDTIASVEMIEAVGAEHWDDYFGMLRARVNDDGAVALQAITMPHDRMLASGRTNTWILKYVFPGGAIPSVEAIHQHAAAAGLAVTAAQSYGAHYAETLRRWRQTFEERADLVDRLGFDSVFRRMWSFYLAYSEAGFRSGYLDVFQLRLEPTGGSR